MTDFTIEPTGAAFGAKVRGLDLRGGVDPATAEQLRSAWLEHQVLVFPDQDLSFDDLEAVALAFGPIGEDPYFRPLPGQAHVVALTREADETTPLFADVCHSDWSFLPVPPAAHAALRRGDPTGRAATRCTPTSTRAYDILPDAAQGAGRRADGRSTRPAGATPRQGLYGDRDVGRSMAIVASDEALATQLHPLVRPHPETGRPALYCSLAYTIGIEGLDQHEADALLGELFGYMARDEHVYRHHWSPGMVALWDNRCLLHAATGGYEGHRRVLHRLTIAERP